MRRSRFSPPLVVFAVLFALIWCAVIFVLAVNPLGVFSWGLGPKLDKLNYKNMTTFLLLDAVIKDPSIDVVLVGSSTGWRFRREMMDRYLPAKNAINLSYAAALPADRAIVMDRLGRLSHVKRIIMTLDWSYIVSPDEMREGFPNYLYDDGVLDKVRMVDGTTFRLAWVRLIGKPLRLNGWRTGDEDAEDTGPEEGAQNLQSPGALRRLAHQIDLRRKDVDLPGGKSCADFATINRQLVPEAKLLASRHIAFDVIVMPLSLAMYYAPPRAEFPFMNRELPMRACAVKALDGIPGVRIFAFDNVPGLADDLANYKNPAHLRKNELFAMMLQAIAQGTNRLTRQNVDSEMALLRQRILHYQIRNSEIPNFATDGP
jgi:hypothetical protein